MSIPIEVEIVVRATAKCPTCKRRLEKQRLLSEIEVTESVIDVVRTNIAQARGAVDASMRARGWEGVRCGQCRDPDQFDPEE